MAIIFLPILLVLVVVLFLLLLLLVMVCMVIVVRHMLVSCGVPGILRVLLQRENSHP